MLGAWGLGGLGFRAGGSGVWGFNLWFQGAWGLGVVGFRAWGSVLGLRV